MVRWGYELGLLYVGATGSGSESVWELVHRGQRQRLLGLLTRQEVDGYCAARLRLMD